MEYALKILMGYEHYKTETNEKLFSMLLKTVASIACTKNNSFSGEQVSCYQIIDKLNENIASKGELNYFAYGFMDYWKRIMQERHDDIGNQTAYLKSCIWTYLNTADFEENNAVLSIPNYI